MDDRRRLILIRHGESEWNREDRFTGWADVGLTAEGMAQMQGAALALREAGIAVDLAYSSVLGRCVRSLWVLLEALECVWMPQRLDWRLNERHYGGLTGQSKSQAEAAYGAEAVRRWRRSFDAEPPALSDSAQEHIAIDRRYAGVPPERIPTGESLKQTVERVREVWQQSIVPSMQTNRSVAVIGHGNSLRALIKVIEGRADAEIAQLEVGNGTPIVYALTADFEPKDKWILPVRPRRASEIL